jgi:3-hydroxyisobutyrate dehydrogenase
MRVGYVGLGHMGSALAARLLREHELLVNDVNPNAAERIAAQGAIPCARPSEIAARADVILLCLPTSAEVQAVIFGENGLVAGSKPGTLIIDQTTGDPAATRAMAAELAGSGLDLIDAPVSGGPAAADAGTIAIMVGASPLQYARAEPVLRSISPNLFHAGGVGAGHVIKLANNMLSAAQRAFTMEAVALAARNGIDPRLAVEIMMASSGRNFFLEHFMGSHIVTGKLHSGFSLGLLYKDVRLATQLGVDSGAVMFFGNVVKEFYRTCINLMGEDAEVNTAALVMDRIAGTQVVPPDFSLD